MDVIESTGKLAALVQNVCMGVEMRTHYSGVETPSICMHWIIRALQLRGCQVPDGAFQCVHACDYAPGPQALIKAMQPENVRPQHLFGNVLDRLPDWCRVEIGKHIPDFKTIKQAKGAERKQLQSEGARGLGVVANILMSNADTLFNENTKADCLRHGEQCCCSVFASSGLKVSVAGSTCVAWSARGAGMGIFDNSFLPFVVWACEVRALKPHVIFHECTPRFPRSLIGHFLSDLYEMHDFSGCPTQFGFPAKRPRQILTLNLRSQTRFVGSPADFRELFARQLLLSADVFFVAPESAVLEEPHTQLPKHRAANQSPTR